MLEVAFRGAASASCHVISDADLAMGYRATGRIALASGSHEARATLLQLLSFALLILLCYILSLVRG